MLTTLGIFTEGLIPNAMLTRAGKYVQKRKKELQKMESDCTVQKGTNGSDVVNQESQVQTSTSTKQQEVSWVATRTSSVVLSVGQKQP